MDNGYTIEMPDSNGVWTDSLGAGRERFTTVEGAREAIAALHGLDDETYHRVARIVSFDGDEILEVLEFTRGNNRRAHELIETINEIQHQQHDLRRAIDRAKKIELDTRKVLIEELRRLLSESPKMLDEGWFSHWCINSGASDLHYAAFDHHRKSTQKV